MAFHEDGAGGRFAGSKLRDELDLVVPPVVLEPDGLRVDTALPKHASHVVGAHYPWGAW